MYSKDFHIPDAYHMAGSPQVERPLPGTVYRHGDTTGGMIPRSYNIAFNTSGPFVRVDVQTTREGIESLRDALNAVLTAEDDPEDVA
jgi:hypothetical protein